MDKKVEDSSRDTSGSPVAFTIDFDNGVGNPDEKARKFERFALRSSLRKPQSPRPGVQRRISEGHHDPNRRQDSQSPARSSASGHQPKVGARSPPQLIKESSFVRLRSHQLVGQSAGSQRDGKCQSAGAAVSSQSQQQRGGGPVISSGSRLGSVPLIQSTVGTAGGKAAGHRTPDLWSSSTTNDSRQRKASYTIVQQHGASNRNWSHDQSPGANGNGGKNTGYSSAPSGNNQHYPSLPLTWSKEATRKSSENKNRTGHDHPLDEAEADPSAKHETDSAPSEAGTYTVDKGEEEDEEEQEDGLDTEDEDLTWHEDDNDDNGHRRPPGGDHDLGRDLMRNNSYKSSSITETKSDALNRHHQRITQGTAVVGSAIKSLPAGQPAPQLMAANNRTTSTSASLLNNTPAVINRTDYVNEWADRHLMPAAASGSAQSLQLAVFSSSSGRVPTTLPSSAFVTAPLMAGHATRSTAGSTCRSGAGTAPTRSTAAVQSISCQVAPFHLLPKKPGTDMQPLHNTGFEPPPSAPLSPDDDTSSPVDTDRTPTTAATNTNGAGATTTNSSSMSSGLSASGSAGIGGSSSQQRQYRRQLPSLPPETTVGFDTMQSMVGGQKGMENDKDSGPEIGGNGMPDLQGTSGKPPGADDGAVSGDDLATTSDRLQPRTFTIHQRHDSQDSLDDVQDQFANESDEDGESDYMKHTQHLVNVMEARLSQMSKSKEEAEERKVSVASKVSAKEALQVRRTASNHSLGRNEMIKAVDAKTAWERRKNYDPMAAAGKKVDLQRRASGGTGSSRTNPIAETVDAGQKFDKSSSSSRPASRTGSRPGSASPARGAAAVGVAPTPRAPLIQAATGSDNSSSTVSSQSSGYFSRTDGGRFSMRVAGKQSAPIKPPLSRLADTKIQRKSDHGTVRKPLENVVKSTSNRSNSSLTAREADYQAWKRRKAYNPLKSAAEKGRVMSTSSGLRSGSRETVLRSGQAEATGSSKMLTGSDERHQQAPRRSRDKLCEPDEPNPMLRSASFHLENTRQRRHSGKNRQHQSLTSEDDEDCYTCGEDTTGGYDSGGWSHPGGTGGWVWRPGDQPQSGLPPHPGYYLDEDELILPIYPHTSSPSHSTLYNGRSGSSAGSPSRGKGSRLEALDSLVISTIFNVSSKLCRSSAESLKRTASLVPPQDDDQATTLETVLYLLEDVDLPASPAKKTSRELSGTLRNLKKVEQAIELLNKLMPSDETDSS